MSALICIITSRSLVSEAVPFFTGESAPVIIVANSQVKHAHASGAYPIRVAECREALLVFQKRFGAERVSSLRDVKMEMLEECGDSLSLAAFHRALHVVTENRRTMLTVEALKTQNFIEVGELLTLSHASLRDNFEVSCEEIDTLVDIAMKVKGVYGSRLTGGGFGGCTITLVDKSAVHELAQRLQEGFRSVFLKECVVYPPMTPSEVCGNLSPTWHHVSLAEIE